MNSTACLEHFFFRCIQLSIHYVFTDCTAENIIVLRHNSHLSTQTRKLYITDIISIYQDLAVFNIIKTAYQINNRRFTSPCRSYKSNCFALSHREVYVLKNIYIISITEGNMLKHNASLDCRHCPGPSLTGNYRLLVNNFKDTLGTTGRIYKLVVKITEVQNRLPEHSDIASKGNVSTNRNTFNSEQFNTNHIKCHGSDTPAQINP